MKNHPLKLQYASLLLCLCISGTAKAQHQNSAALLSELQALYDIAALPAYRTNTFSAQASTYDTTGGNNDGFNGNYSFVRRNKDSSLVLLDIQGPGVINRIWTPTPTTDTFDFYIDDTLHPALSVCYMDLFSGKLFPFVQPLCGNQLGGYYCYFPILFQQHCMIVCRGKAMQFHQLQYRLFPKGTVVKPFTVQLTDEEKTAIQKIQTVWNTANKTIKDFLGNEAALQTTEATINLQPGTVKQLFSIKKGGRITGIELSPAAELEGLYKNMDIRIFWDDESLPAVDCPAADFFGYAFGKHAMQSLLLGTAGARNYCYFPMPFDKKASIELVYRQQKDSTLQPVQIHAKVYYTLQPREPQREGKLYTEWHQERPAMNQPHIFANIKGKGHYVATLLQAQGLRPGMTIFFEGDDSTVIDGSMRLHGTGSEDYFNGGWYALLDRWDTRMSLPLHGALDYSLLFGRTGGYRLYLNDKLSFEKSFYHTIEHGPEHNAVPALYTSLCFYYSNTPVQHFINPAAADTKVYIPDTLNIFPQFTKTVAGDDMQLQTSWDNATIGQSYTLKITDDSKLKLSLEDIPPGDYQLFATYAVQPAGCSFSVWQRQTQLAEWINTQAATKKLLENKSLGSIRITELNNAITLRFNTTATNNSFILGKLMLVKVL